MTVEMYDLVRDARQLVFRKRKSILDTFFFDDFQLGLLRCAAYTCMSRVMCWDTHILDTCYQRHLCHRELSLVSSMPHGN
jgi:hypothetical protein